MEPEPIRVNDLVKIVGRLVGRVVSIIQSLGAFKAFDIQTETEELKQVLPETVRTPSASSENNHYLPENVLEEQLMHDYYLFDDIVTEKVPGRSVGRRR